MIQRRVRPHPADLGFVVALVAAVPIYLALRIPVWFGLDDWDMLTSRRFGSWSDLVRPHFDHFSALPVIVYRLLLPVAGLDSRPFQLVTILLHLGVAVLLRIVMLRAGVDRWVATSTAVVLVGFAAGHQNITYGYGMSFAAVLVLGLAQMLLADHDGAWDRRDWIAMGLGIIAVTSSGVAVAMLAVVFGATWPRRTLRVALAQVGPAAFVYLVWLSTAGRRESGPGTPGSTWRFVHTHAWGLMQSLSSTAWLAPLWIGLVTVGLAATVIAIRWQGRRSPLVPVAALAGGALLFSVSTGVATEIIRWYDVVWPTPRHLHVLATFLLPAMAVGADRIVRGHRAWRTALIAVMLIPLPLGFVHLREQQELRSETFASNPRLILGVPRLSFADQLPSDLEPDPVFHPGASVGWLLDLDRRGLLPDPPATSPVERAGIAAVVALADTAYDGLTLEGCTTVESSTEMTLQAGDRLVVVNAPAAVRVVFEGATSVPTTVEAAPYDPGVRTARVGPLIVKVTSVDPDDPATVCAPT